MNILYKYCDQKGTEKILESLELKLPYISEVNDPLECFPFFYCPDDKLAIETRYLSVLKRRNLPKPADYKQVLNELYEKGEIQNILADSTRRLQKIMNLKSCLLSVSKTAKNTVMWTHYADEHKGAIIGIDFDSIFPDKGIKMDRVNYTEERPRINILTDFQIPPEAFFRTILTKSSDWEYEQEFRAIFPVKVLDDLRTQGLASLKDFNNKKTWFLRLNPASIREIVFGLHTEKNLKLAIRKIIERSELQHVQLYQTQESETYLLNLISLDKTGKTNGII
jgi:hypothetical protein